MTSSRMALRIGGALALIAVLAGCDERKNPGYQGWVEADMIFVSPDESGRVIKLNVREGDEVRVACDNCAADLTAKIYFIATSAEYTPPVIYSLDERNKLVYLVQARPSRPDVLRVGQPIGVFLNAKTPVAAKR